MFLFITLNIYLPAEKVAVGNVACFKSDIGEYCKASKGHIETTLTHFSGQIYPSTFLFMIFEVQAKRYLLEKG